MAKLKVRQFNENAVVEEDVSEKTEVVVPEISPVRAATSSVKNTFEADVLKESSKRTFDIPLDMISSRNENNFIMAGIEELANDIEKNGQIQEIVVNNADPRLGYKTPYYVVVGHRRLSAFRLLCKKYGGKKYSTIRARLMTPEEALNEEGAYIRSNASSRNITIYEALLNCDIKNFNLEDEETKKKYLEYMYTPEERKKVENKQLLDHFNQASKIRYFTKKIREEYPMLEVSEGTVKVYYIMVVSQCDELKQKVLNGEIGIREAQAYAKYPIDEQKKKIEYIGKKPIQEIIKSMKSANVQKPDVSEEKKKEEYAKLAGDVKASANQMITLIETFENYLPKNPTGNQKDFIKKAKAVKAKLIEIKMMPK